MSSRPEELEVLVFLLISGSVAPEERSKLCWLPRAGAVRVTEASQHVKAVEDVAWHDMFGVCALSPKPQTPKSWPS